MSLEDEITELWVKHQNQGVKTGSHTELLEQFVDQLEKGEIRAAEKHQEWQVNDWVKKGILLNFALRENQQMEHGGVKYHDKFRHRDMSDMLEKGSRNTPNGSIVRSGAYIGSNVIMMSPCYLNIGSHVGDGTLVDSNDVVGSCAQVGENVKLGANTVVGGVLEPIENNPVIIEDDVSLGAGSRVTSGFIVREGSVTGENTLLSPRLPVYDLVEEEIIYGELPAGRKAFMRYVESSFSDHKMFSDGAYKPAIVAVDKEEDIVEKEKLLRK